MVRPVASDVQGAAAANLAAWHSASVGALGIDATETASWWTTPLPAPTIYHSAISLRPAGSRHERRAMREELARHLDDPDRGYLSVCDSWDDLALDRRGLRRRGEGPWFARPAGPLPPTEAPGGFEIRQVTDERELAAFETAMVRGFQAPVVIAPFEVHAPPILRDPHMTVLTGCTDGEVVTVGMVYRTSVVGIYGIATVPGARGRGYATAMTAACIAVDPTRTATLQPTVAAESLYRRLGFAAIGHFSHWG